MAATTIVSFNYFRDGVAADPLTLAFRLFGPGIATESWFWPRDAEIVRDSVGQFHIVTPANIPGDYAYQWIATADGISNPASTIGGYTVGSTGTISISNGTIIPPPILPVGTGAVGTLLTGNGLGVLPSFQALATGPAVTTWPATGITGLATGQVAIGTAGAPVARALVVGDVTGLPAIASAQVTDEANIAANTTALALKAPLASPTFTDTVTVPVSVNPTDAAQKADVTAANSSAFQASGTVADNNALITPLFKVTPPTRAPFQFSEWSSGPQADATYDHWHGFGFNAEVHAMRNTPATVHAEPAWYMGFEDGWWDTPVLTAARSPPR